ncbi:MAG: NADH:flavin oxidoreductase [Oscillospiraceae bacterium]|nr:NADH:flavin oxidoreductase [Oscillospiraceae bacterium]
MLNKPIQIGTLTLKNRLVMPPMHTGMAEGGYATAALADYYHDRAACSEPGLIIMEHCAVASDGRASQTQLRISDDDMIPGHRMLTEAIHAGGSRVLAQLNHAGSNGIDAPVSASAVSNPRAQEPRVPHPLTPEEMARISDAFVSAAVRAMQAGYDGVELHCAHAYLFNQFYSPLTNQRTDAYGGSVENRLRFLLETFARVRAALGADVPVAVRLGGADYMPGGATEEDAVEAALLLESAGADLLDVSGGMCGFILRDNTAPGYFGSMTEKIRRAVHTPVLLTGGVQTISDAERLLAAGKADLIGVGRVLMRDAHWREHNP